MSSLQATRAELRNRLADEETSGSELLAIVLDIYGARAEDGSIDFGSSECLEWLPTVIVEDLQRVFEVDIPETAVHKLGAAQSLILTNYFYQDLQRFIDICNALSGTAPDPRVVDLADADEVLWGVFEATALVPPDPEDPDDDFCEEIAAYIKEVLEAEGLDFDLIALGQPVGPRDFGLGDPDLEAAMGSTRYEQSHELVARLEQDMLRYHERMRTLPLRSRRAEPTADRS